MKQQYPIENFYLLATAAAPSVSVAGRTEFTQSETW